MGLLKIFFKYHLLRGTKPPPLRRIMGLICLPNQWTKPERKSAVVMPATAARHTVNGEEDGTAIAKQKVY